jgi:amidohydrolase
MTDWPDLAAAQLLDALVGQLELVLPAASSLRRELHQHPDLSGTERPTAERLRQALPQLVATQIADTGFLVRLGPPGPAVVLRSELDALPLIEQTQLPWAATNHMMHACGHDVHLAALWAVLQAATRVELPVGLIGLFQPREETQPSGALDVAAAMSQSNTEVTAVIGAHLQPRVAPGVISTGAGVVNAASDEFTIVVHGHPGHGAYPQAAIDPVPVLAAIVTGLQELIGRGLDPTHPAVITVGRVDAGTAANIIAARGVLRGVIRTMHEADRVQLHSSLRRLAEHTAAARGAYAEVNIVTGDPVLNNDCQLVSKTDPILARLGVPVATEPFRSCGADDFSHYSELAPILMMFVGVRQDPAVPVPSHLGDARGEVGLHHPAFYPPEESIRQVALALIAGYVAAIGLTRQG